MGISDYIKMKLVDLVEKFPEVKASYEYDSYANQHVIEVLPKSIYDSKAFMEWEFNFGGESLKLFPNDLIGFISEDAVVPLEKVDFSVQGTQYGLAETKPRHKASARYYSENYSRSPVVCEGETPYLRKQ